MGTWHVERLASSLHLPSTPGQTEANLMFHTVTKERLPGCHTSRAGRQWPPPAWQLAFRDHPWGGPVSRQVAPGIVISQAEQCTRSKGRF